MAERPAAAPLHVVPLAREPWTEMIEFLRAKLAQAEAGELRALVMAFEYADGRCGNGAYYGEHTWPMKLAGELAHVEFLVHRRHAERLGE